MEKILITPKEAGRLLSISENKVRELCVSDPTFPSTKNGAHHKVFASALPDWAADKCKRGEAIG
jgi:hypothetical protein